MNRPVVIGITGGIGSGKSTLSEYLQNHGFPVYDTDKEARRLQNEDSNLVVSTKKLLGEDSYKDGKLDRSTVAARVFTDRGLLRQLTSLVHPVVKRDIKEWLNRQSTHAVFIESAVLFEGGFETLTDAIIVVTAPEEQRIQRVMVRDGIVREQVMARIKNQLPEAGKLSKADLIISTENGIPNDAVDKIRLLIETNKL